MAMTTALSNAPSRRRVLRDGLLGAGGASAVSWWRTAPPPAHAMDYSLLVSASSSSPPPPTAMDPLISGSTVPSPAEVIGSWSPPLYSKLGQSRILASELRPLSQSVSLFGSDPQELYYAPFLFGTWKVRATLRQKTFPYGRAMVPFSSLIEGSPRNRMETVDSPATTYTMRYFSTLANTLQNQVTVQLGRGVPQSKIIADRASNAIAISKAYQQLVPIQDVEWDPSKDPTRLSLLFPTMTDDFQPLGPRRGQVYITARQSESPSSSSSTTTSNTEHWFACSEQSRTVTVSATDGVTVSDLESSTEFQPSAGHGGNHVRAYNRLAVYLTPNPNSREGVLWQQVQGKAVALYDYELDMERQLTEFTTDTVDDAGKSSSTARACVTTPKGFVQCE